MFGLRYADAFVATVIGLMPLDLPQDWPITNFAPIHPTGQVSIGSDNHTKTLARNTIWLVNNHTHWHVVNGICL
eukprot:SAG11_NODE_38161_length_253_cov_1.318182_1_plen_73_part_10